MKELLNFRTGNKYILTEEFVNKHIARLWSSTRDLRDGTTNLPKGLVFTIVSVNLNNCNQIMRCKIIRSKKIVEAVYKPNNIDPKFYTALRYNDEIDKDAYVSFYIQGVQLFEFLNTSKVENFTSEYKRITDEYTA